MAIRLFFLDLACEPLGLRVLPCFIVKHRREDSFRVTGTRFVIGVVRQPPVVSSYGGYGQIGQIVFNLPYLNIIGLVEKRLKLGPLLYYS